MSIKLSDIVKLNGYQHIVIGDSGTGKTHFLQTFLQFLAPGTSIEIYGSDANEWRNVDIAHNYNICNPFDDSVVDGLFAIKNKIVVFDDFLLSKPHENKFVKERF